MLVDPFCPHKKKVHGLAGICRSCGGTGIDLRWRRGIKGPAYGGLILTDHFSLYMHAVVTGVAALAILGSFTYFEREKLVRGEYYSLILFAPRAWEFCAARANW